MDARVLPRALRRLSVLMTLSLAGGLAATAAPAYADLGDQQLYIGGVVANCTGCTTSSGNAMPYTRGAATLTEPTLTAAVSTSASGTTVDGTNGALFYCVDMDTTIGLGTPIQNATQAQVFSGVNNPSTVQNPGKVLWVMANGATGMNTAAFATKLTAAGVTFNGGLTREEAMFGTQWAIWNFAEGDITPQYASSALASTGKDVFAVAKYLIDNADASFTAPAVSLTAPASTSGAPGDVLGPWTANHNAFGDIALTASDGATLQSSASGGALTSPVAPGTQFWVKLPTSSTTGTTTITATAASVSLHFVQASTSPNTKQKGVYTRPVTLTGSSSAAWSTAPVKVGDLVWIDTDQDGIQDSGEPGIEGVSLSITKAGGGSVTDLGGSPVGPTTTNANGLYEFGNLPAGQYTVTVGSGVPPGYVATTPHAGSDPAKDSSTGWETSTTLAAGEQDLTLDFGYRPQTGTELSIEKTADKSLAAPGETVTYTITARNTGETAAEDVVVTDTLPAGTTFVSATAPCGFTAPTVTCSLGTVAGPGQKVVTIEVTVDPVASTSTPSHRHQLDYTKVESHLSIFDGDTSSATATCPSGYLATDGSVRIDHVDAGTGTFEDVVVLASGVTTDGRGWTGTVRSDATGQVQVKVNVVCMTEKTTSGEDHSHHVVTSGPVATTRTLAPGRNEIDLSCGPNTWAMTPSFLFTSGEGIVSTRRLSAGNWRFTVDVDAPAEGTFSIRCLGTPLSLVQGHSHDLMFHEITDSATVPAGEVVERRLTCAGDEKGIVAWSDLDPGLVSLGNDPQPVTRVFRFYNPTGAPLTARFGLLCVAIRTNGGAGTGGQIKNTASVSTTSPDATTADDKDSATFTVNATGVTVAPRASVVTSGGKTLVKLAVKSSGKRSVQIKLLAVGKVKGSKLTSGSLLAKNSALLRNGKAMVRLLAQGAGVKALNSGKVTTAKLVVTTKDGSKNVRIVKIRR